MKPSNNLAGSGPGPATPKTPARRSAAGGRGSLGHLTLGDDSRRCRRPARCSGSGDSWEDRVARERAQTLTWKPGGCRSARPPRRSPFLSGVVAKGRGYPLCASKGFALDLGRTGPCALEAARAGTRRRCPVQGIAPLRHHPSAGRPGPLFRPEPAPRGACLCSAHRPAPSRTLGRALRSHAQV